MHLEHVGDLSGIGDDPCPPVTDELVGAGAGGAGHRAGDRTDVATQVVRLPGGVQRAGADPGLDHDGRVRQGGQEPVAREEPVPGGRRARWRLADSPTPAIWSSRSRCPAG